MAGSLNVCHTGESAALMQIFGCRNQTTDPFEEVAKPVIGLPVQTLPWRKISLRQTGHKRSMGADAC